MYSGQQTNGWTPNFCSIGAGTGTNSNLDNQSMYRPASTWILGTFLCCCSPRETAKCLQDPAQERVGTIQQGQGQEGHLLLVQKWVLGSCSPIGGKAAGRQTPPSSWPPRAALGTWTRLVKLPSKQWFGNRATFDCFVWATLDVFSD